MKIFKIFKVLIILIITLFDYAKSEITFRDFLEMAEQLGDSSNFNNNPKMIIFFRLIPRKKKSERRKLDYLSRVLQTFLNNLNIRGDVYNIENRHYVAIINKSDEEVIDKTLIINQFKDLISEISIHPPDHFKKKEDL